MHKPLLTEFSESSFSQWGEDGIIAKIFTEIGIEAHTCIEFGAWDGFHLANTAKLWTNGWKGILIEGDRGRFKKLVKGVAKYNCVCINAFVGTGPDNSLEALLAHNGIFGPIDLLSIDIDGDDYHIFASLTTLRPRLAIIEYNPTIPADLDVYAEQGSNFGCSVAALNRIAAEKGYKLVALTETNTFFVRDDLADRLNGYETELDAIRIDKYLVYIMAGYNGSFALTGKPIYGVSNPFAKRLYGNVYQPTKRRWWKWWRWQWN